MQKSTESKNPVTSMRLPEPTRNQIEELAAKWRVSAANIVQTAIERMYREEIKAMKQIKVGETNDLHLFAIEADGRYYPLTKKDLGFETPDAKIYYDSGIYPGITLDELPQYICDKARAE
jgi:predicted DNA-binding protein